MTKQPLILTNGALRIIDDRLKVIYGLIQINPEVTSPH